MFRILVVLALFTSFIDVSESSIKGNYYAEDMAEIEKKHPEMNLNLDVIPGMSKFPMSKELRQALEDHMRRKSRKRVKRGAPGKKRSPPRKGRHSFAKRNNKGKSWHVLERRRTTKAPTDFTMEHRLPHDYEEKPMDLYRSALRPGVIFRIFMAEALLKMQNRNYIFDIDESIIDADMEYIRLTRKVLVDEITKLEDFMWLSFWFMNKTELERNYTCDLTYTIESVPASNFSTVGEHMKRQCLFKAVYIDYVPYVIGKDHSIMAAVAPPVLHCDAGTCASVPFVDSLMFEPELPISNVRLLTKCDAGCRKYCRNDQKCLERCAKYCNTKVSDYAS